VGSRAQKPAISLKWCKVGQTLNGRNVTLAEIVFQSLPEKNVNEDRHKMSAAECKLMILVSRNIRFVQIFTGVPYIGGAE